MLIGVNDSRYLQAPLRYAEKDAFDLGGVLQQEGYQVILLTGKDVHKQAIRSLIRDACKRSESDDVLLVVFSGHGIGGLEGNRKGIFSYWDNPEYGEFYSQEELITDMSSFRGNRYLVLDACFQGSQYSDHNRIGLNTSSIEQSINNNQLDLFIAASSSNEAAYEGVWLENKLIENGIAIYLLLEGIRGGAADKNGDNIISIGEMVDYIERKTGRLSGMIHQVPEGRYSFYNLPLVRLSANTVPARKEHQDSFVTLVSPSGETYIGEAKDGKKHGQGTLHFAAGGKYSGEWVNNRMEGFGTFIAPGGGKYVGEWKSDTMEGHGSYIWPDGRKFVGGWRAGRMHGHGTYTWPDGKVEAGEWREGKKQK